MLYINSSLLNGENERLQKGKRLEEEEEEEEEEEGKRGLREATCHSFLKTCVGV